MLVVVFMLLTALALIIGTAAATAARPQRGGAELRAHAAVSTPPAGIRSRYRACSAGYALKYKGQRIGCYRRGRALRKPHCAAGYHHPRGHWSCERNSHPTAPVSSPTPATPARPTTPAPPAPTPPAAPINTANPPAASTQYWSTGRYGQNRLSGIGTCTYLNAWNQLRIATAPPVVYAHDDHPGAGNDSARVWYRAFLVNAQTGQTASAHNYSAESKATDTTPAVFDGAQSFDYFPSPSTSTVLDIRIEWWSATALTGAVAHRVASYYYYVGGAGPIGPIDSCSVILQNP